jgi:hypothetical protein
MGLYTGVERAMPQSTSRPLATHLTFNGGKASIPTN